MSKSNLITLAEPFSLVTESYKMLRTNLHYMNAESGCQVLIVTSSDLGEGKTTTAANLAVTIAQSEKRVLLIDGDLRRAKLHLLLDIHQCPGLTHCLSDAIILDKLVQSVEGQKGVDVLTSGVLPPNPSEILGSKRMEQLITEARKVYDYIIIDTPPILVVTDALALSKFTDGIILVAAVNETKISHLTKAKELLEQVNAKVLGVLMTKASIKSKKNLYSS